MTEEKDESEKSAELRSRAVTRLMGEPVDNADMSPEEARRLLHELRTHQIELEMQNEELCRAQTELDESRNRYADLYDFAPLGYVTIGSNGLILEANLAMAEMLKVERRALPKRPFSKFVIPEDQDILYRHMRIVRESNQRHTCRLRLRRVEDTPIWAEMESIFIDGGDERDAQLRTSVRDITGTMTLESRLRQVQKIESIGMLAGGVAHEINNPINGIMNYAQLILDRLGSDSPVSEYAAEIVKESERVATIVKNLLSFSRSDNCLHTDARMSDIVGATLTLIRTYFHKDHISLTVDVPDDLPQFKCCVQQIRQVIMNLATNARDALNEKYPGLHRNKVMTITAGVMKKNGEQWIRMTIEDHGTGIASEEVKARIFDPFYTMKAEGTGTGLGLPISREIIEKHGGKIGVESEAGEWTRFHVDLPA